jgi:hypothetical protein
VVLPGFYLLIFYLLLLFPDLDEELEDDFDDGDDFDLEAGAEDLAEDPDDELLPCDIVFPLLCGDELLEGVLYDLPELALLRGGVADVFLPV